MSKSRRRKKSSVAPLYRYIGDSTSLSNCPTRVFILDREKKRYKAVGIDIRYWNSVPIELILSGKIVWCSYGGSIADNWIRVDRKDTQHIRHWTPKRFWYKDN